MLAQVDHHDRPDIKFKSSSRREILRSHSIEFHGKPIAGYSRPLVSKHQEIFSGYDALNKAVLFFETELRGNVGVLWPFQVTSQNSNRLCLVLYLNAFVTVHYRSANGKE